MTISDDVENQAKRIAKLETVIEDQAKRIAALESTNKVLNERIVRTLDQAVKQGFMPQPNSRA